MAVQRQQDRWTYLLSSWRHMTVELKLQSMRQAVAASCLCVCEAHTRRSLSLLINILVTPLSVLGSSRDQMVSNWTSRQSPRHAGFFTAAQLLRVRVVSRNSVVYLCQQQQQRQPRRRRRRSSSIQWRPSGPTTHWRFSVTKIFTRNYRPSWKPARRGPSDGLRTVRRLSCSGVPAWQDAATDADS